MADETKLTVQEVAVIIGSSVQTINGWYRWKALHPDHELAELIPEYTRLPGGRLTRYWNQSDIWRLIQFKKAIPQGRHGIMGDVTQKYAKKNNSGEEVQA